MAKKKKTVRKIKIKTLDEFLTGTPSQQTKQKKKEAVKKEEKKTVSAAEKETAPITRLLESLEKKQKQETVGKEEVSEKKESSATIIDEILKILSEQEETGFREEKRREKAEAEKKPEKPKEIEKEKDVREKVVQTKEEKPLVELGIITGELIKKLLALPVGPERGIVCDNTGKCSDGRNISDIFVDNYGVKRQRGFIRTSRIPIIVDWVAEKARAEKILTKAYKVETSRGAMALIPDEFICDMVKRYGVLIEGVDCSNYQVNLNEARRKK